MGHRCAGIGRHNSNCKTFSRSCDYRLFESKIVASQPFFKTPTAQKPMPGAPKYGVIGPFGLLMKFKDMVAQQPFNTSPKPGHLPSVKPILNPKLLSQNPKLGTQQQTLQMQYSKDKGPRHENPRTDSLSSKSSTLNTKQCPK